MHKTPQFSNGAIGGTLGSENEIFIPVAGSAHGIKGTNGLFSSVTGDVPTGTVDFIAGAPIFVYGSVIDNQSGDGSFVEAQDNSQFDSLFNAGNQ